MCKQCNMDTALPRLIYDDLDRDRTYERVRYQLICEPRFKHAMGGDQHKLLGDHIYTFFSKTMPLMSPPEKNFRQINFQERSLHGWFKLMTKKSAGDPKQKINTKGTIARITSKFPYAIGDDNENPAECQMLLTYKYVHYDTTGGKMEVSMQFFVTFSNYDRLVNDQRETLLGEMKLNNKRHSDTPKRHELPNWCYFLMGSNWNTGNYYVGVYCPHEHIIIDKAAGPQFKELTVANSLTNDLRKDNFDQQEVFVRLGGFGKIDHAVTAKYELEDEWIIRYNNVYFNEYYLGSESAVKNLSTWGDPDIFFIFDPQPGNYMPHRTIKDHDKAFRGTIDGMDSSRYGHKMILEIDWQANLPMFQPFGVYDAWLPQYHSRHRLSFPFKWSWINSMAISFWLRPEWNNVDGYFYETTNAKRHSDLCMQLTCANTEGIDSDHVSNCTHAMDIRIVNYPGSTTSFQVIVAGTFNGVYPNWGDSQTEDLRFASVTYGGSTTWAHFGLEFTRHRGGRFLTVGLWQQGRSIPVVSELKYFTLNDDHPTNNHFGLQDFVLVLGKPMPESWLTYSADLFPSEPGQDTDAASYSFYSLYEHMREPSDANAYYVYNSFGRSMIRNITIFRNTGFQTDCPKACLLCTKNFDCLVLDKDSNKKLYGTTVVNECPPNMKTAGYNDPTIENNQFFAPLFAMNNMICTRKRVTPVFYKTTDKDTADFNTEPQGVAYLGVSSDGENWMNLRSSNNPEEDAIVMKEFTRYMLKFNTNDSLRLGFSAGLDTDSNIKRVGISKKESICLETAVNYNNTNPSTKHGEPDLEGFSQANCDFFGNDQFKHCDLAGITSATENRGFAISMQVGDGCHCPEYQSQFVKDITIWTGANL